MMSLDRILEFRQEILSRPGLDPLKKREALRNLEQMRRAQTGGAPLVGSPEHLSKMTSRGAKAAMISNVVESEKGPEYEEFDDPEEIHYGTAQQPLTVQRVIDADTVEVNALGEEHLPPQRWRVPDINAPELDTVAGQRDLEHVRDMIEGETIIAQRPIKQKYEHYGRRLGKMYATQRGKDGTGFIDVSRPYLPGEVPGGTSAGLEAANQRQQVGELIQEIESREGMDPLKKQSALRNLRAKLASIPTPELAQESIDRGYVAPSGLDKLYLRRQEAAPEDRNRVFSPSNRVDASKGFWRGAVGGAPTAVVHGLGEPVADLGSAVGTVAGGITDNPVGRALTTENQFTRIMDQAEFVEQTGENLSEAARDVYTTHVAGAAPSDIKFGSLEGVAKYLDDKLVEAVGPDMGVDALPGSPAWMAKKVHGFYKSNILKLSGVNINEVGRLAPIAVAQILEAVIGAEGIVGMASRELSGVGKMARAARSGKLPAGLTPMDLKRIGFKKSIQTEEDAKFLAEWQAMKPGDRLTAAQMDYADSVDDDFIELHTVGGNMEERLAAFNESRGFTSMREFRNYAARTFQAKKIALSRELASSEALIEQGAKRALARGDKGLYDQLELGRMNLYGSARSSKRAFRDATGYIDSNPLSDTFAEFVPTGESMDAILRDLDGMDELDALNNYMLAERQYLDMPNRAAEQELKHAARPGKYDKPKLNEQAVAEAQKRVESTRAYYQKKYGGQEGLDRLENMTKRLRDWSYRTTVEPLIHVGLIDEATAKFIKAQNPHYADFTPFIEDSLFQIGGDPARLAFSQGPGSEAMFTKARGAGKIGYDRAGGPLRTMKGTGLGNSPEYMKIDSNPVMGMMDSANQVHYWVEVQRLRNSVGEMLLKDPGVASGEAVRAWTRNTGKYRKEMHGLLMEEGTGKKLLEKLNEDLGKAGLTKKARAQIKQQKKDIQDRLKEIPKERAAYMKEGSEDFLGGPRGADRLKASNVSQEHFSSYSNGIETRWVTAEGSEIDRLIRNLSGTQASTLQALLDSGGLTEFLTKVSTRANSLFRTGVVGTVEFGLKNFIRDMQLATSRGLYGVIHPGDMARGFYHALTNSTEYRKLMNSGADGGNFISGDADEAIRAASRRLFGEEEPENSIQLMDDILTGMRSRGYTAEEEGLRKAHAIRDRLFSPFIDSFTSRIRAKELKYGTGQLTGMDKLVAQAMNAANPMSYFRGARSGLASFSELIEQSPRVGIALKTIRRGAKGKGMGPLTAIDHALKQGGYLRGIRGMNVLRPKAAREARSAWLQGFKRGRDEAKAPATYLDAIKGYRQTTIDFSEAGRAGEFMNSIIPFSNAELQDARLFMRSMANYPLSTTMKSIAAISTPALMNWYRWYDDPDYNALSASDRALNYHIWKDPENGRFWRMPKPMGIPNLIFGNMVQAMMDWSVTHAPQMVRNLEEKITGDPSYAYNPMGSIGGATEKGLAEGTIGVMEAMGVGKAKQAMQNMPGQARGSFTEPELRNMALSMPMGNPDAWTDWLDDFFSQSVLRYVEPIGRPALVAALNLVAGGGVEDTNEDDPLQTFAKETIGSVQVTRPILENLVGENFFFNSPLEPRSFTMGTNTPEAVDIHTTTTADSVRMFHEKFGPLVPGLENISPMKLEALVRGYTGTFGGMAVKLADMFIKGSGMRPEAYDDLFEKRGFPGISAFAESSRAYGPGSDGVTDFYNYYEHMMKRVNSRDDAIENRNLRRAHELLKEGVAAMPEELMKETSKQLQSSWDAVASLREHPTMSTQQKEYEISVIQQKATIRAMAAAAVYRYYLEDPDAFSDNEYFQTGKLEEIDFGAAREYQRLRRELRLAGEDLSPNYPGYR